MNKNKKKKSTLEHLLIHKKNVWDKLGGQQRKELHNFCEQYRKFLSICKTERETNRESIALAEEKGFVDFYTRKGSPSIKAGDKFYINVKGKTLLLFHIGKGSLENGCNIIGGHTDSPRLDLKPRPLYEESQLGFLDTHYYGGIKKYQWVTIPLALHGVIVKKNGEIITIEIGENPSDPVFVITDLLPHLGKDQATKKLGEAISGEGLNVLFGSIPIQEGEKDKVKLGILNLLNQRYGIDEEDLISAELELVPAGEARDLGIDRSMILGYGHDDRVSVFTSLRALLDLDKVPTRTSICVLTDKEEIGSVGSTGMYSFLFENAVAEVLHCAKEEKSPTDILLRRCLKNSRMLSADVNALHDPNYPDVSSPNHNMAQMNHGLVLTKYVGSRGKSGSNDANAEYLGQLRKIFDDANVLWQTGEIGKVDQGGGGTISFMLARYEMEVIDCGVGVLSMHAPWEVVGKADIYMAYKGYSTFFTS